MDQGGAARGATGPAVSAEGYALGGPPGAHVGPPTGRHTDRDGSIERRPGPTGRLSRSPIVQLAATALRAAPRAVASDRLRRPETR